MSVILTPNTIKGVIGSITGPRVPLPPCVYRLYPDNEEVKQELKELKNLPESLSESVNINPCMRMRLFQKQEKCFVTPRPDNKTDVLSSLKFYTYNTNTKVLMSVDNDTKTRVIKAIRDEVGRIELSYLSTKMIAEKVFNTLDYKKNGGNYILVKSADAMCIKTEPTMFSTDSVPVNPAGDINHHTGGGTKKRKKKPRYRKNTKRRKNKTNKKKRKKTKKRRFY